jgi:23S rRNA pseudouridine1911/1915/1917 synthase
VGLPDQVLNPKDLVAYSVVLREPPVNRGIQILYEEEDFLVASKPGLLPSHADGNFIKNTFIYILSETLRERGWKGKSQLVHRLDRETSGLMVVAKTQAAHLGLVKQFEEGLVEKEYLAVAQGEIAEENFQVEGVLGRDPASEISIRRKLLPPGTPFSQPSLTRFEKVRTLRGATLLRCLPKTGRTSQIRVHLDSIGHPLVGDKLYGRSDGEFLEFVRHVKAGGDPSWPGKLEAPRQLLHASKLDLAHPGTGARLTFEAPLPADMAEYIARHEP